MKARYIMWKKKTNRRDDSPQAIIEEKLEAFQQKRDIFELLRSFVIIFVVCFIVFGLLLGIGRVKGNSMYTTLCDRDIVLLWRPVRHLKRSDIIFFRNDKENREVVKRIIGLPGDTIEIDEVGDVLINGTVLDEDYVTSVTLKRDGNVEFPVILGEDEYFVMGDNRAISYDSRETGPVKRADIDGKVIFVARYKVQ